MARSKDTTKTCSQCSSAKDRGGFHRDASRRDGLRTWCKACVKSHGASYNASHRESMKVKRAASYAATREESKATAAAYRSSHPAEVKAYGAAYRDANREKERARSRAYNASGEGRAAQARSRAKHPVRERARVALNNAIKSGRVVRQSCENCGLPPKMINGKNRIHAHHHRGYAKEHWLDIVWLCSLCHGKATAAA